MNTSELNASTLNGEGITAGVAVPLGAVSATLQFIMYERSGTEMSGTATIRMEASGNLARLVLLGAASAGITFSQSATISEDMTEPLGAVSSTMTFTASADLHRIAMFGNVAATLSFAVTGSLYGRVLMAGASGITFTASGALMQYIRRPLAAVSSGISFDAAATIFNYTSPGGVQSDITFDVDGLLSTLVFISGSAGISFDVSGVLFNNPAGQDLDSYTMIRPYVDRTMVRES